MTGDSVQSTEIKPTGLFFYEQTVDALQEAVHRLRR